MPSRFALYPFQIGEILLLKKKHPCGGDSWLVQRVGADIGMKCQTCGKFQTMPRQRLEKSLKEVIKPQAADICSKLLDD